MAYLLPGYAGTIWTALRTGLSFVATNLDPNNPQAGKAFVVAMAGSLKNGLTAIETNLYYTASNQNYVNLAPIAALPLALDAATQAFLLNRITALQAAVLSASSLLVSPVTNISQTLLGGNSIVPDPGFLGWMLNFGYEIPPTGLTTANFMTQVQAAATAWVTIAAAMQMQGVSYNGASLNAANQMGYAAQATANVLANMAPLPSGTNVTQAWNVLVVQPTLGRFAALVYNDPTSAASQDTSVIRYVILTALRQFNALIVSLRQGSLQNVKLSTVRQGDSLMDIAARELGDFSQWYQIAQLNALVPPFISSVPGPGVAAPGQQVFLPTSTSTSTTALGQAPDYQINYLGVDIWFGALNQDMPAWTGDYQLISGYQNLAFSLGRRLQTTLGTLIYQPSFGSRVPPEVGNIASTTETSYITAFTESALLSDPRVNRLSSVSVTTPGTYSIAVNATVVPNGLGSAYVTVNEVLGPA